MLIFFPLEVRFGLSFKFDSCRLGGKNPYYCLYVKTSEYEWVHIHNVFSNTIDKIYIRSKIVDQFSITVFEKRLIYFFCGFRLNCVWFRSSLEMMKISFIDKWQWILLSSGLLQVEISGHDQVFWNCAKLKHKVIE